MRKLAILAIAVALTLTGCAAAEGSMMNPQDAEQDARDIFERTSQIVLATNWTTEVTWGPCEEPRDGHVQLMLVAQSLTDVPVATSTLAQAVAEAWQKIDRKPTVTTETAAGGGDDYVVSDPAYLTGTNADGSLTQLSLSDKAVFLQVVSPCVSGDLDQLHASTSRPTVTPPSSP